MNNILIKINKSNNIKFSLQFFIIQKMETKEPENSQNNNKSNEDDIDLEKEFEILPNDCPNQDFRYKIIIIGNSGVGKTCLSVRITTGEFSPKSSPTLGFDYFPFFFKYKSTIVKLEIWDTCGQENYRSLIKSFYVNSSLAIIVYAIDDINSFNSVEEWTRQCRNECSPETKFILIGSKADLGPEK